MHVRKEPQNSLSGPGGVHGAGWRSPGLKSQQQEQEQLPPEGGGAQPLRRCCRSQDLGSHSPSGRGVGCGQVSTGRCAPAQVIRPSHRCCCCCCWTLCRTLTLQPPESRPFRSVFRHFDTKIQRGREEVGARTKGVDCHLCLVQPQMKQPPLPLYSSSDRQEAICASDLGACLFANSNSSALRSTRPLTPLVAQVGKRGPSAGLAGALGVPTDPGGGRCPRLSHEMKCMLKTLSHTYPNEALRLHLSPFLNRNKDLIYIF